MKKSLETNIFLANYVSEEGSKTITYKQRGKFCKREKIHPIPKLKIYLLNLGVGIIYFSMRSQNIGDYYYLL